jgi:hypothetical protein
MIPIDPEQSSPVVETTVLIISITTIRTALGYPAPKSLQTTKETILA